MVSTIPFIQDIYFEEWADYFGDCITSCNKVENCLLSEYDPEYAVLIEKRARRWSAVRPSFAQAAHAGIGATAAAVASGVMGVGTNNGIGGSDAINTAGGSGISPNSQVDSTVAGTNPGSVTSSSHQHHHHHHLLAPGSFHIIPTQLSQLAHQQSLDGFSSGAPLASGEGVDEQPAKLIGTSTEPSQSSSSSSSAPREIPAFRNHPPRPGRRSTAEPPSRSITVIDEASV